MKTFFATVRASVGSTTRSISTEVRATSSADAKWLLQAVYGFHSVLSGPTESMKGNELDETITPKSPDQQRVANLQATRDRASDALKAERTRQKRARALRALTPLPTSSVPPTT